MCVFVFVCVCVCTCAFPFGATLQNAAYAREPERSLWLSMQRATICPLPIVCHITRPALVSVRVQAGRGSMDVPSVCKMESRDGMGVFVGSDGKKHAMAWEPLAETPRFDNNSKSRRPQTAAH